MEIGLSSDGNSREISFDVSELKEIEREEDQKYQDLVTDYNCLPLPNYFDDKSFASSCLKLKNTSMLYK